MGHFSREEIEEIVRRLATYGKKDTEFETASDPSDDDIVAIVQDFENKKISLADIRRYFGAPYLPLDGSSSMEGDLDVGDHNIKNVADPTLSHHAANKQYVDGVASELDSEISNIDGRVQGIEDVIPSSVDPDTNQLADKAWVRAVNDLVNYYKKSETYTQAEVDALIGSIEHFHYEIVATLPATGESNILYLLGPKSGTSGDMYEEYVYSSGWVKIGDTSIDLSGYMPKTGGTFTGDVNIDEGNLYVKGQISVEGGEIIMTDEPTSDWAAINKGYVDTGLSGKAAKAFKCEDFYLRVDNETGMPWPNRATYLVSDNGMHTFLISYYSRDHVTIYKLNGYNDVDGTIFDLCEDEGLNILLHMYKFEGDVFVTCLDGDEVESFEPIGNTTDIRTITPIESQPLLVSGTNIKTINSTSLLGSGDIQISADTSNCVKFGEAINASNGYLTIYGDETFALMLVVVLDDEVSTYIVRGNQSPTVSAEKIEGVDSFQYAKRDDENGTLALYHEDNLIITPILLSGTMPTITDLASASGEEEEIQSFQIGKELPSGGTAGQVLTKASGTDYDVEWSDGGGGSSDVFWATYGSTTAAEMDAAIASGKAIYVKFNNRVYTFTGKLVAASTYDFYWFISVQTTQCFNVRLRSDNNQWQNLYNDAEKTDNRVSTLSGNETNTTKYPNTKAVADALGVWGVESQTIAFNADGTRTLTNVVWGIIPQGEHNIYLACRGVEFNDTDSAISKTAPWGETVQHLPGYYYLNGLGDISRQEMAEIYGRSFALTYDITRSRFSSATLRTIIPAHGGAYNWAAAKSAAALFSGCPNLEVIRYVELTPSSNNENIPDLNSMQSFAYNSNNVFYAGVWRVSSTTLVTNVAGSRTKYLWLKGLKNNLDIHSASNFDLGCLAYIITNAGTATITITLHASVYTAAQTDAGVQAALAAKTNVSLQRA